MENITIQSCYIGSFEKAHNHRIRHIKALPYISIVQATEGYYAFGLNGSEIKDTREGGFFIAPSLKQQEIIHNVSPQSKMMSARWVFLQIYVDDFIPFDRYFSLPVFLSLEYENRLNLIFNKLFAAKSVIERKIQCHECIKLILPLCKKNIASDRYVSCAVEYIRQNFKEQLTVEKIAKKSGVSPSYLYSLFKKELGLSPIAYLNDIKLSHACMLLKYTIKSISQIAEECGICDQYYFSKLFKRKYGCSPLRYKQCACSLSSHTDKSQ